MTSWLIDTLVWTGALIALVLVLRRPVARWFGPGLAYALWAIPFLRLVLPPLELPAWMNPAPAPPPASEVAITADAEIANLDRLASVATPEGSGGLEAAATDMATPLSQASAFEIGPFIEVGLAVWLIGAAIFLYQRFSAYFRLRTELLDGASEVGREGRIRLIETGGTDAPLAFGVIDKVIALPRGFLAQPDRQARDLALAHELQHHKGRDLLANVMVQPLFALHWFNPLARYGWLALRRDQEAACDARVIAAMTQESRAPSRPETIDAYANLIVSFAAGPNIAAKTALTAPMACPVLGEKSIIHRLRSLNMNDRPQSRRLAGRLMLGAAVVALPLTASISYAASEAPQPPAAPEAPIPGIAPPAPPAAPLPPEAPLVVQEEITEVDPDVDVDVDVSRGERRSENVFVMRMKEGDEVRERRWTQRGELSEEERAEIMEEVREALAEARAELDQLPEVMEEAMEAVREAEGHSTVVKMSCDHTSDEVATTSERADGVTVVRLCQARVMAHALEGLKEARAEIARNREMTKEMRERVTRELDREIRRWERDAR